MDDVVVVLGAEVVVSAGTTTVTVEGSTTRVSVTTPPVCGAPEGIVTLPLSDTFGHCGPEGVSVTVVGSDVSVVVSVTVSVTTGSPLTGSTGAVSVTVTGSVAAGSSAAIGSSPSSSPGTGMSLGVSDAALDSVVDSKVESYSPGSNAVMSSKLCVPETSSDNAAASLTASELSELVLVAIKIPIPAQTTAAATAA
ncbi:hypothetical protein ACIGO9_31290 [Nocardia asteroides]|uniref:hypothetical protein n=1 Tax=Nocardia asteroides TaxID=1824 RepID=UPI0037C5431F